MLGRSELDLKKIWVYINIPRTLPGLIVYISSPEKLVVKEDINRWIEVVGLKSLNYPIWKYFHYLMLFYPAFRNLFYYRIKKNNLILSKMIEPFHPSLSTLYIETKSIGPGLFIQHGFSTIISAESIGKNCWINQQVTIGFSNRTDVPILGDNVRITAGAKVIGKIKIGNNSIVGANAVVVKDVPENCTVVGVPASIIKKDGVKLSNLSDC
jgi:serine O-acetyltransferase